MKKTILAAAVAAALVLASCGGDDGDDAAPAEDPPSETVAAGDAGDGDGDGDEDPFCDVDEQLGSVFDDLAPLVAGASADEQEAAVDRFYEQLDGFQERVDAIAADAPDEIRDDVEVFAEKFGPIVDEFPDRDELLDAIQSGADDPAQVQQVMGQVMQAFGELEGDTEFAEANANIEAWAEANCG